MFRHSSINKQLLALILPITFLWSWAACTLLCSEITAHHEKQSIEQKAGSCLVGIEIEGCPYTTNAAVIEARQIFASPLLTIANVTILPAREFLFIPVSIYPEDRKQNSPPNAANDPPLFLRHCTFRI